VQAFGNQQLTVADQAGSDEVSLELDGRQPVADLARHSCSGMLKGRKRHCPIARDRHTRPDIDPISKTMEQAMAVTIYGIKTCDTMKKAFAWLEGHGVAYTFHDYRAAGIDRATVAGWCKTAGWEKVLNKASTTFRELPEEARAGVNEARAIDLMLANPTMIKRPVLDTGRMIEVGFKSDRYAALLG
jgi:arsenate reductase